MQTVTMTSEDPASPRPQSSPLPRDGTAAVPGRPVDPQPHAGEGNGTDRPARRSSLRVTVAGRSRVIAVNREDDVIETTEDLIEVAKTHSSAELASFWDNLEELHAALLAEGGPADQKTIAAVSKAKAASERVILEHAAKMDLFG